MSQRLTSCGPAATYTSGLPDAGCSAALLASPRRDSGTNAGASASTCTGLADGPAAGSCQEVSGTPKRMSQTVRWPRVLAVTSQFAPNGSVATRSNRPCSDADGKSMYCSHGGVEYCQLTIMIRLLSKVSVTSVSATVGNHLSDDN